ncbi:MAG: DUF1107 domain-containing protein [Vibrionaceae bacterium]
MLRIFHQYRPRQVALHVKGLFRGRIYINGIGGFEFDCGRLLLPANKSLRIFAVVKEVNAEVKKLKDANFFCW